MSDVARVEAKEKIFPEILRDYFKAVKCEDSYCSISRRLLRDVLKRIALDVKKLAGCRKVSVLVEAYSLEPTLYVTRKPVAYLTVECWREPGKEPEKFSLRLSSDEPFRVDLEEGAVLVWKPRAPDFAFEKHRRGYEL